MMKDSSPLVVGLGGLGVNITSPGDTYLSLGTSVISGTFSDRYIFDPAFRKMKGGVPGSYIGTACLVLIGIRLPAALLLAGAAFINCLIFTGYI